MDIAQTAPETVVLAEDEAWMYLQATTMNIWSPGGLTPIVRVDPGRQKVGFYGTLNLHTGDEIVTRSSVFSAEVSAQHLEAVLIAIPDRPLLMLWDRAPWHRGDPIQQVLHAHPRLELMFLPVAAPDLNPQEHVWKHTRRAVSHNHLTPNLPALAEQFEAHLRTHTFECSFLERFNHHALCSMFN